MKNIQKKLLILTILLIALLTASTVNATNIMANNTVGDSVVKESHISTSQSETNLNTISEDSINDDINEITISNHNFNRDSKNITTNAVKTIKSANENNILSANPTKVDVHNANELANLFDNQSSVGMTSENLVINLLDGDYKLTTSDIISRKNMAYMDFKLRNLTINGNNNVIDGDNKYNFINLDLYEEFGLVTITLNNIVIKNCNYGNGGAIYSWGTNIVNLTINECIFENNSATTDGGVIRFMGGYLNIINSNFTNNHANTSIGGAIHSASPLTVKGSRFENNGANTNGGAISADKDAIITDSVFINNSASGGGGAIYNSNDGILRIINSNFTENSVTATKKARGGAVYTQGILNITYSNFDKNTANSPNSNGGAIYSERNKNLISFSNFTSNTAYAGGAIAVEYTLEVNNSNFIENHATLGGAVYSHVKNTGTPIFYEQNIVHSNFTSNTASNGGAIYTCTNLVLSESNITNNSASTNGGAIYIDNNQGNRDVTIKKNTFKDNYVTSNNWVVYLNKATTIQDNLFVNNTLGRTRDMLFNVLGKSVTNNVYIDNYLRDSWEDLTEPITMVVNQEKELHLVNLRNVYNNTIVNGTIYCYLEDLKEPFASFNITNGNATLVFNESKLNIGLNNVKLKYISLSKHYQNLERTLKIILKEAPISINVTKIWDDGNNPNRPTSVTIILSNDTSIVASVVLNENNKWNHLFENLPSRLDDNTYINYTITEANIPEGYIALITNNTPKNFTVTNIQSVILNVTKIWDDNNNQDGIRPINVTINLTSDGVVKETVTLNSTNNWKYSFVLPKFKDGNLISYNFTENTVANYNRTVVSKDYAFNIINSHNPENITLHVSKLWNDNFNQDGLRPNNVIVRVWNNDTHEELNNFELNVANSWKHSFVLPKFRNGALVNYTVTEDVISNYNTLISNSEYSFTVTNTHIPGSIEVTVSVNWDDNNNQDGIRPNSVNIILHNATDDINVVLNENNNWRYSFANLPKYKDGNLIQYTITEDSIENYTTSIVNESYEFNVTNTHIPKTVDVKVSINWNDSSNNDGMRPNYVEIQLYANGVPIGNPIKVYGVNDADNQYIFEGLPKYEDGKSIKYAIGEAVPNGYTESIISDGNKFTITNNHKLEEIEYTVDILWEDNTTRPNNIKLQLFANDVAQGEPIRLDTKSNQSYVFKNLLKYKNGKLIKYTARLLDLPKDYTESITETQYGLTIKLKKSANKTVKWAWKLVKIAQKPKQHKNNKDNNAKTHTKSHTIKTKSLLKLIKTTHKSTNYNKHSKKYKLKSSRLHKHDNNYNKTVTYKYRLYIYFYSEYKNGSISYKDFVAILKENNINITKSNWKNGVIIVDYDDIDDVPDCITLHNKKGEVPDSSSKVNKTKAKHSANVIDSDEVDTSISKNIGNSESDKTDNTKSKDTKGVVDSDEVEINTE